MKFVAWLAGGSVLTAIVFTVVSVAAGLEAEREIWFGMTCPTLTSVVAWAALERQRRLNPQNVSRFLIQAFAVKILFFAAYIVVLVKTNQVRPRLFIVCFAFFYLALHIAEAFELRRVQAKDVIINSNN